MGARSSGFPLGAAVGFSAAAKFDSLCTSSGFLVDAVVGSQWVH